MTKPGEFLSTRLISLCSQTCAVSQHETRCKWISRLEICSTRTIYNVVNSNHSAPVSGRVTLRYSRLSSPFTATGNYTALETKWGYSHQSKLSSTQVPFK